MIFSKNAKKEKNKLNLSKEEFVKAMNDVESVYKYQEGLNNFFRKNNVEGYIFQPDCAATVLRLLHMFFDDKDKNEWIEYYCFELNFGKKWEPGIIRDDNGTDIVLQTPEDLYDVLQQSK